MYAIQAGGNLDVLLAGDEISFLSTVNGTVKKKKFNIKFNFSRYDDLTICNRTY
jgi:hypothetical protein